MESLESFARLDERLRLAMPGACTSRRRMFSALLVVDMDMLVLERSVGSESGKRDVRGAPMPDDEYLPSLMS